MSNAFIISDWAKTHSAHKRRVEFRAMFVADKQLTVESEIGDAFCKNTRYQDNEDHQLNITASIMLICGSF